MDKITIKDLEIFANHGVFKEENILGQKFVINAVLYTDIRKAGINDDLTESIHYGEVCNSIKKFMEENTYKLIEAAAENLAVSLLTEYKKLEKIELEIKKPWAPVKLPLDTVSVKIERGYHNAYIALGSNMGDKEGYFNMAIDELGKLAGCEVVRVSDFIVTKPYGGVEQDDFLNGALLLKTILPPIELLDKLHEIEKMANRERIIHWGPRTLDLDILMYDKLIFENDDLVIPHVEMHKRDFVLKPMVDIAPNLRHPIYQKTMTELLESLNC